MTNEQRIKSILQELEHDFISYENLHNDNEQGCKLIEAVLKKQIPEKPKIELNPKTISAWQNKLLCPNCEAIYFESSKPNYCPNCGQAIDWEEKE